MTMRLGVDSNKGGSFHWRKVSMNWSSILARHLNDTVKPRRRLLNVLSVCLFCCCVPITRRPADSIVIIFTFLRS